MVILAIAKMMKFGIWIEERGEWGAGQVLLQIDLDRVAELTDDRIDISLALQAVVGTLQFYRLNDCLADLRVFQGDRGPEGLGFAGLDLYPLAGCAGEDIVVIDIEGIGEFIENRINLVRIFALDIKIEFQIGECKVIRPYRFKGKFTLLDRQPLLDKRAGDRGRYYED